MKLDVTPTLKLIPVLEDVPRRILKAVGKQAKWFSLPGGAPLFLAGEPSQSIYFVLSGTLGTFRTAPDGHTRFIGHARAGEPAGEMALFMAEDDTGDGRLDPAPHSASCYAMRDSEVLEISREGFNRLVKAEPEILSEMMKLVVRRLRERGGPEAQSSGTSPKVFTLVSTSPTLDLAFRANALKAELNAAGLSACIVSEAEGNGKNSTYFDALERDNDIVMLLAPMGDTAWFRLALRQADRLWIFGRSDARPSWPLLPEEASPAKALRLVDVIIVHPGHRRAPAARPREWLEAAGADRLFHWNDGGKAGCAPLARVMSGRSVGLVFSGGGARAYAHIGVVRAFREAGVELDFVGGTSMGAVVAACVAMGWNDSEIERRIRDGFVKSDPLGDFNLPVVALTKGRRVDRRLAKHFGDREIGELTLPFFAVSTNLTSGTLRVHRSGLLREALRATIALPGILPPVVSGPDVLADGGILSNFPVEVMRNTHRGVTVGCDVSRAAEGLDAGEFVDPPSFAGWVFRHGTSAAPPIAGLLMRAATLHTDPQHGRDQADLLVLPELEGIALRDWKAYDSAVAAGERAARKLLEMSGARERLGLGAPALSRRSGAPGRGNTPLPA